MNARAGLVLAIGLVIASLLAFGLWQRGQALKARAERDAALIQAQVLGRSIEACSAGVEQAKLEGRAAIATGRALLAEARRLHAPGAAVAARLEELLARATPAGAGCDQAWQQIEKAGAAR